jgi:tRNA A-37 threonylcarbamoyl transferase component Bud32
MLNKVTILNQIFYQDISSEPEKNLTCILSKVLQNINELAYHQNWFSRNIGGSIPKGLQIMACELAKRYSITVTEKNLAKIIYLLLNNASNNISCLHSHLENFSKNSEFSFINKVKGFSNSNLDKIYQVLELIISNSQTGHFTSVINECESQYSKTYYTHYHNFSIPFRQSDILFANIMKLSDGDNSVTIQLNKLFTINKEYGYLAIYALGVCQNPPIIFYTKASMIKFWNQIRKKDNAIKYLFPEADFQDGISTVLLKLYSEIPNDYKQLLKNNNIPIPVKLCAGKSKTAFYITFKDNQTRGFAVFTKLKDVDKQLKAEKEYLEAIDKLNPEIREKMNKQSSTQTLYNDGVCIFSYNPGTHKSVLGYLDGLADDKAKKVAAKEINCQLYMLMLNNLEANLQHGDLHMNNLIMVNEKDRWILKQIDFGHRRHNEMMYFSNSLIDLFYMLQGRQEYKLLKFFSQVGIIEAAVVDKHFPDERVLISIGYSEGEIEKIRAAKQELLSEIKTLWFEELADNESRENNKNKLSPEFLKNVKSLIIVFLQKVYDFQDNQIIQSLSNINFNDKHLSISQNFLKESRSSSVFQKACSRKYSVFNSGRLINFQGLNFDSYESNELQRKLNTQKNLSANSFTGSTFSNTPNNTWLKIFMLEKGCDLEIFENSNLIVVVNSDKMRLKDKLALAADIFLKEELIPMPLLVKYVNILQIKGSFDKELINSYPKLIELLQAVCNDNNYLPLFLASAYFIHNLGAVKEITSSAWKVFTSEIDRQLPLPKVWWDGSSLIFNKQKFSVINFLPDNIIYSGFSLQGAGKHKKALKDFQGSRFLMAVDEHALKDFDQETWVKKYIDNKVDIKSIISLQEPIKHSMIARVDGQGILLHEYIKASRKSDEGKRLERAKKLIQQYLTGIQLLNKSGIVHNDPHALNIKVLTGKESESKLQFFDFGNSRCSNQENFNILGDIQYMTNNNKLKVIQQWFSNSETKCRRMVIADIFYILTADYNLAYEKFEECCKSGGCLNVFYTSMKDIYGQPGLDNIEEAVNSSYSKLIEDLSKILMNMSKS